MAVWRSKIPHVGKYFSTWREISYLQAVMYIMFSLFYKTKITPNHFTLIFFWDYLEKKVLFIMFYIFWRWLGIFMHEDVEFYFWKVTWYFIFVYVIIMVKVIARQTDIPLWYGRAPRLTKNRGYLFSSKKCFLLKKLWPTQLKSVACHAFFHWIPWTNTKLFVKEFSSLCL